MNLHHTEFARIQFIFVLNISYPLLSLQNGYFGGLDMRIKLELNVLVIIEFIQFLFKVFFCHLTHHLVALRQILLVLLPQHHTRYLVQSH